MGAKRRALCACLALVFLVACGKGEPEEVATEFHVVCVGGHEVIYIDPIEGFEFELTGESCVR